MMSRAEWRLALQMGATYIGTVVGAGFASGQEVLQFFTRFGTPALFGIAVTTALFILLGGFIMSLGRWPGNGTFGAVAASLLGQTLSRAVNILLIFMLIGVTIAMVAGSGALLQEQTGLPFLAGAALSVVIAGVTVLAGLRAIMIANSLIVPSLLLFVALTFIMAGGQHAAPVLSHSAAGLPVWLHALAAAITYAGFNVGLSLTVLVPLGRVPVRKRTLWSGAAFGALGLGFMLLLMHLLLTANASALAVQVPIGRIAQSLPPFLRIGFMLVLWGEIYSTLLANVYGIARELQSIFRLPFPAAAAFVLLLALGACRIGFARIVSIGYPLFGYGGLVILGLLIGRAGELRLKQL